MENEITPVTLYLELHDHVVVARHQTQDKEDLLERFATERLDHYKDMRFLPDNELLVVNIKSDADLQLYNDYFNLDHLSKDEFTEQFKMEGRPKPFSADLRLAGCCRDEYLKPSRENMMALEDSDRYREFWTIHDNRQWEHEEKMIADLPPEKRYDDWSFVFGTTGRQFTDEEKKDIQALGNIMSGNMEFEYMTKRWFPSVDRLKPHVDYLNGITFSGLSISARDIPNQLRQIRVEAANILGEKYPEVAGTMKELCGIPTPLHNEVYALLDNRGNVENIWANGTKVGFYDYIRSLGHNKQLQDKSARNDFSFVRYRFDDPVMMPPKEASPDRLWDHVRVTAEKYDIKPVSILNFNDAVYCFKNGRNPMHPDNRHEKLTTEKAYRDYCTELKQKFGSDTKAEVKKQVPAPRRKPVINRNPAKSAGKGLKKTR